MATETDIARGGKTRQRASRTRLAVGYARRSTDRQEQSIGDQRRAVEAYALSNGCEIIDWYVAARLNEQNVPSPRGGKWSMTTVRDLLSNPNYAGDLVWNRRTMAKFNRVASRRAVPRGRILQKVCDDNDQDDWVVTEGAHEALVDGDTFQAAQALRAKRQHSCERNYRRGRGARSDYLLTGLVVCAHCGHKWQGYTQRKGRRRVDGSQVLTRYYACGGYVTKGTSVCARSVISKDVLEGRVFDAIAELVGRYVGTSRGRGLLVSALRQALAADVVDEGELGRLTEQRENIHRKITGILDNLTETNREFADARIRELKEELKQVEPRLEELKAKEKAQPDVDALADEILTYLRNFDEVVAEGTVDERRRFIRAFVHRIVLEPGTLQARITLRDVPLPAV